MEPYVYDEVEVVRVVDGDSVYLRLTKEYRQEVDFGFRIYDEMVLRKSTVLAFRLADIDAPEKRGIEKVAGLEAQAAFEKLLKLGKLKAKTYKPDKYGRWLVELFVTDADGKTININEEMVRTGFAVPYE
jgi:endonuclease YncB( thermonuclease family)